MDYIILKIMTLNALQMLIILKVSLLAMNCIFLILKEVIYKDTISKMEVKIIDN